MRLLKQLTFAAFTIAVVISVAFYQSCKKKDPCSGVTCHNRGVCNGGSCNCPTGSAGKLCDTVYKTTYANTYQGTGTDNEGTQYTNFHLVFAVTDTFDNHLVLNVRDAKGDSVNVPVLTIDLTDFSSAGASFTIEPAITSTDTFRGSGSIKSLSTSLRLTQTPVSGRVTTYNFNNFTK